MIPAHNMCIRVDMIEVFLNKLEKTLAVSILSDGYEISLAYINDNLELMSQLE